MSLKKRAEACFQQNNLVEAKKLYLRAYQANRNDIDARFMLGAINGQQNLLAESEACFRDVVKLNPQHYPAWDNLGIALMMQSRDAEAESCLRKATQIKPDYAQGFNNLGNLLKKVGRHNDAVSCYQRALQINPQYGEAHNNLGALYYELDRLQEAIDCCRKALQIDPHYPDALTNLGIVLHKAGNSAEAISCLQRALQLQPQNVEIHRHLATLYWDLERADEAAASIYQVLSTYPADVIRFPRRAVLLAVLRTPGLVALLDTARQPGTDALEQALLQPAAASVLQDRVLLTAMFHIILSDLDLENLFSKIRQLCLHTLTNDPQRFATGLGQHAAFLSALAFQCFSNEYVYLVSPEEYSALARLAEMLGADNAANIHDKTTLRSRLRVFAMYTPLYMLDNAETLLQSGGALPEPLQRLARQQLLEPVEEERIRASIPSLTDIHDATSRKVGQQYDEAPFPRWLHLNLPAPRPYTAVLNSTLQGACPVAFTEPRIKILVAGCGTGSHALSTAAQYADADILAIDISSSCLAYAQRKADEMSVKNVTFKHADILELGGLEERFHVIEVVGVLQTMNDPDLGLRILTGLLQPQGLMKIAIYSKIARRAITTASADFKRRGFTSKDDDIRRLRQEIIALDPIDPIRKTAIHLWDFYSLSECRNMYFLVHEVEHTVPDIAGMLDHAGLEFLRFSFPNGIAEQRFRELFADSRSMTDLDAWNSVEERFPDIFINMYSFWVRPRT